MSTAANLFIKLHRLNQKLWFIYIPILSLLVFLHLKPAGWSIEYTVQILIIPYEYIYQLFDARYAGRTDPIINFLLIMAWIILEIGVVSFIIGALQKIKNYYVPKH